MLTRAIRAAITVGLMSVVVTVAPAHADPLVSGYGGPGSADQEILGSTLLPAGPGGGGRDGGDDEATSLRAAPTRVQAPPALTPEPSAPAAAASVTTTRPRRSGQATDQSASTTGRSRAPSTRVSPAGPQAVRPVASVRSSGATTSAGALPVAGSDLLIALAVAAGLGIAGFASARLASEGPMPV